MPVDHMVAGAWQPPETIPRDDMVRTSEQVLGRTDIPIRQTEHIFRIPALGLDWDVGVMVYQPEDATRIARGGDGNRIGIFILHGGSGDYRSMDRLSRLLVGKFGYKVTSMTYPGRLYLPDPTRDWPDDTIHADGAVRTPVWLNGEDITPDQYDLEKDISLRARYGTRLVARAKPGTLFHDRMAAWPVAFEEAMKQVCRDHLPDGEFSIYVHGHSTGGPFVHMLSQRVANIRGIVGIENSPFAYIYQAMLGFEWTGPFNDLLIRTWRDIARYKGAEVLSQEGGKALMRLPWVMEEVFDEWDRVKSRPQFKAEYPLHYAAVPALTEAARAAARRLGMKADETAALIARYSGYCRELSGPDVKPVPPVLLGIAKHSRDHTEAAYSKVVTPMFAAMNPAPRVRVVRFDSGTHAYEKAEDGLPMGLVPAVAQLWHDAIMGGYYLTN